MNTLRYFITSKAKRSVLKLFLSHPDGAFYTREVARLTAEPLNAVRRELGYLEKAGLLRTYAQGNLKYYQVVRSFPVLAEWQKIILSTPEVDAETDASVFEMIKPAVEPSGQPATITLADVVSMLHNVLNPLSSINLAVIHGKAVASEAIPEDGIDLLVVGDLPPDSLLSLLADVEDKTGVSIKPVRMTHSDFDYRNAKGDPLIRRIWSEKKLVVKGRH